MDGAEFFNPGEAGESYDPQAFERFKDQIKANAQFFAALQKGEKKQKEKEDKLFVILMKFIKANQKSAIVLLAARLLEQNIPASFILSIILLGNDEIQQELKREVGDLLSLPRAKDIQIQEQYASESGSQSKSQSAGQFSLMSRLSDHTLPLKIRLEIDAWAKGMFEAGAAAPFKVLETVLDNAGVIKQVVIDACANIMEDFVEGAGGENLPYDKYFGFCELLLRGIMNKLKEQIENQKELN